MSEIKYNSKKRTHEKIKEAFKKLLQEKSIKDITAVEISEKAGITRGTFYAHFLNAFEVAREYESDLISSLIFNDDQNNLHELFNYLKENEEFYRELFTSDCSILFIKKLNEKFRDIIYGDLKKQDKKPMAELDASFYADGATYTIFKYFRNEISLSLDEIEWYIRANVSRQNSHA